MMLSTLALSSNTFPLLSSILLLLFKCSSSQTQTLSCNANTDFNKVCGPCTDLTNTACNLNCALFDDICVESILTCQSGIECNVACSANYACMDSIVDATLSSSLSMTCSGVTGCEGSQVVTGSDTDIVIDCNGSENSCKDLILNAQTAGNVIVNCDGFNACNGLTVNAQTANDVTVNCNNLEGAVCSALRLNCGAGDCLITCDGANPGASEKCPGIQVTYTALTRSFICVGDLITECESAPLQFGPPTLEPSANPSTTPSISPTKSPTLNPTQPTAAPTLSPVTKRPTSNPTTRKPSISPSISPTTATPTTGVPTTAHPTYRPTDNTKAPSNAPTLANPTTPYPTTPAPTSPTPAPTTPHPTTPNPTQPSSTTTPAPVTPSPIPDIPGIPKTPTIPTTPTTPTISTTGAIPAIPTNPTNAEDLNPTPTPTQMPTSNPTIYPTFNPSEGPTTSYPTTATPTADQTDNEICCLCAVSTMGIKGCAKDPGCTDKICDIDPYCCETQWDNNCAYYASDMCSKTQQTPETTSIKYQEAPNDLDLVWKFALVVFAIMVLIVSCCIILLRIHRMCQNCKRRKLQKQPTMSAKKVKKRGAKGGKILNRGDSMKRLRSGGVTKSTSPAIGIIGTVNRSHKNSEEIREESRTMTHDEDELSMDENGQPTIPAHISSVGSIKKHQSSKIYLKRQYSNKSNKSDARSILSGGGSQGYGYNNVSGLSGAGMNIVNNMTHFVAARSYPYHNKLASNSNTTVHPRLAGPPDLEYGTGDPLAMHDRMMMNNDKYIINDIMDDEQHHIEDSLSITDNESRVTGAGIWGVPTINTFSGNSKSRDNKRKRAGKTKHRRGGGHDPKDPSLTSIATTVNTMNTVDIMGINGAIKPIASDINSHKSTETSVDEESSDVNNNGQHEDGRPEVDNEEEDDIMPGPGEVNGDSSVIRRVDSVLKKRKEKRQRGASAVNRVQEIGPEENQHDNNNNNHRRNGNGNNKNNNNNNNNQDSDETDEEITVSDDPISEIMKSLKKMQSVKHHSI